MDDSPLTDAQLAAEIRREVEALNKLAATAAGRGIIVELTLDDLVDDQDNDYPAISVRVVKEL